MSNLAPLLIAIGSIVNSQQALYPPPAFPLLGKPNETLFMTDLPVISSFVPIPVDIEPYGQLSFERFNSEYHRIWTTQFHNEKNHEFCSHEKFADDQVFDSARMNVVADRLSKDQSYAFERLQEMQFAVLNLNLWKYAQDQEEQEGQEGQKPFSEHREMDDKFNALVAKQFKELKELDREVDDQALIRFQSKCNKELFELIYRGVIDPAESDEAAPSAESTENVTEIVHLVDQGAALDPDGLD